MPDKKEKKCCCSLSADTTGQIDRVASTETEEIPEVPKSERKTIRSEDDKKKMINRLSRIEGQIRGIRGMVERGDYCPDIMLQVSAANAALNSFNKELLSRHLHSCVTQDLMAGREDTMDELLDILKKLMK